MQSMDLKKLAVVVTNLFGNVMLMYGPLKKNYRSTAKDEGNYWKCINAAIANWNAYIEDFIKKR